jgi:hypothetical protein
VGCTNCQSKTGCDHRKTAMIESVDHTLARLYPTRTWGELDDAAADGGLAPDELAALADELATTLGAATFVRPGDDEPCDFIYVLCMGRTPCVVQVRDHGVPIPSEWRDVDGIASPTNVGRAAPPEAARSTIASPTNVGRAAPPEAARSTIASPTNVGRAAPPEAARSMIEELYLRVVIGQRARVAEVQQVAIDLVRAPGGFIVRERPRAGVYDAPLLPRMQRVVATLPAYDLLHVDFGEIAHAPPGFHAGAWRELFGGDPAIANYLFYAPPTTMVATVLLEAT